MTITDNDTVIETLYGVAGLEQMKKEQRTKLLPQLQAKRAKLEEKAAALQVEINEISKAEDEIEDGHITAFKIRQAKKE